MELWESCSNDTQFSQYKSILIEKIEFAQKQLLMLHLLHVYFFILTTYNSFGFIIDS